MFRLLFIFLFLFSIHQNSIAQDSLFRKVDVHFGMTRMDFFTGVQYSMQVHQWQPFVMLETGINRTFFQNRIYPRVSLGSAYFFLKKGKYKFGPQVSYSYSVLRINKNTSHYHQWNEVYLGSRIEFGSKFRFTNVISGGWMNERFYNQLTNKRSGVNALGFYFNFGICYVW